MTGKSKTQTDPTRIADLDARQLDLLTILVLGEGTTTVQEWFERAVRAGVVEPSPRTRGVTELRAFGRALVARQLATEQPAGYFKTPSSVAWHVLQSLQRQRARRRRLYPSSQSGGSAYERVPYRQTPSADLRLAILDGDVNAVREAIWSVEHLTNRDEFGARLATIIGEAHIPEHLDLLDAAQRDECLWPLVANATLHLRPISDAAVQAAADAEDKKLRLAAARLWVLRGQSERAVAVEGLPKHGAEGIALLVAFWSGDYSGAAEIGAKAITAMRNRKRRSFPDLEGVCHVLAGLVGARDDPSQLHSLAKVAGAQQGTRTLRGDVPQTLAQLLTALLDDAVHRRSRAHGHGIAEELAASERWVDEFRYAHRSWTAHAGWLAPWIDSVHDRWLELPSDPDDDTAADRGVKVVAGLRAWAERAAASGYPPIATELSATADLWAGQTPERPGIVAAFSRPAPWRAALAGLQRVAEDAAAARAKRADVTRTRPRLIWQVDVIGAEVVVEPRLRKTPRSVKGTPISVTKLIDAPPPFLTPADRRVLATAQPDLGWGRRGKFLLPPHAVAALANHRDVIDPDGAALHVQLHTPSLSTQSTPTGVAVTLDPPALSQRDLYCRRDGNTLEVFERDETLEAIVGLLGRTGVLEIPTEATTALSQTLSQLCVAGNIEVTGALAPKTQQAVADPRPVLTMVWTGETLSIDASVAPLGLDGPHVRPGIGVERLSSTSTSAAIVECVRDLADERRRMEALETGCPTLMSYSDNPLHWHVRSLPDALEIMLEFQRLGDAVIAAWPKGRPLSPPRERDLDDLKIKVATKRDWIGVTAELSVDEAAVISYRALIAARTGRRFVALGRDRFVALSEKLRRRIEMLAALGPQHAEGIKANPTLLAAADDLFAGIDANIDSKARARIERVRALQDQAPPPLRGFRGTLRDYQRDGYAWLWRRAEGQIGACLADDMGLGKTIQALALLQSRGKRGPALVVCPTSVVINWCREAQRFTPGLTVSVLVDASDRAAAISGAGKRDVLVCSYGILSSEIKALAKVAWSTVVFDEAHALKNDRTQRTIAARRLQADARIGLTGTPVENRVQELWSLFTVLVPGLLGPKEWFEGRFAEPIGRGDQEASRMLRRLLEPFLLRRTKAEVLEELPPRTEVTISVEPNSEQTAYYEALRERAKDRLKAAKKQRMSAKDRSFLLAEILKLRQAAVDPQLLDDTAAPRGAKLDMVVEHVAGLAEHGHRTLIFTQFLGSLSRLTTRLQAAGLTVLSLQGSTPARERARLVDAFQADEADAFVLSLRAGGMGLNLTAADHVVHVDPWWNPAVEDQATDRSHRIGQRRPVTVARFVTEGTIEERIMELHDDKRGLVDDLVGGLRGGGLDLEELRRLIG